MNTLRAGIHHIEFWVANLEESISFYDMLFSIIGWRKLSEGAYSTGESEIYFKEVDEENCKDVRTETYLLSSY